MNTLRTFMSILKTILFVFIRLFEVRLSSLAPIVLALFLIAIMLYFLNLSAPLAPFVYSLF